ncbi:MAG TPA: carboxymuconolactone decarboxylase family protein [Burkholderiaceae bacterium]|nr:carboxymuconolactone decarboxylase family protein [Burkholderiaceae bacterium]
MTRYPDRLPPLAPEQMNPAQRAAADDLIKGPRKGVKGPFIALLRSPELLARLQKVGEYLRFENALPARLSEFATLVVARAWAQQFEWFVHVPLALAQGTDADTIAALRTGRRSNTMSPDEALVYDFTIELTHHHGVSDDTYRRCVEAFGERGAVDLVGTIGYFAWMSMILNVAHTPAAEVAGVEPLPQLPL